ncbi:hypothetical protein B0H11DRAFT_2224622 [Mycena galericulata]|nr:hypothetical protein B0H11DRAFT_2224622 [Mycena galericulata]
MGHGFNRSSRGYWPPPPPKRTKSLSPKWIVLLTSGTRVPVPSDCHHIPVVVLWSNTSFIPEALLPNIKYEDRVGTITATIEIKSGERNAGDIKTWERLLEMIEHLREQGMSSEEEDEIEMDDIKVCIFRVKLCVWREPRVVEYVRFVDAQTALFKKKQRGPIPASRIRSDAPGSSKAPCGLPKSLYNGEWLKKSTPAYLKELKVSKEEFGLFVAAPERMAL